MNNEVRQAIAKAGLKYWQVADAVGVSETTLYVWMRHELTGEKRTRVMNAIETLCKQRSQEEPVCR